MFLGNSRREFGENSASFLEKSVTFRQILGVFLEKYCLSFFIFPPLYHIPRGRYRAGGGCAEAHETSTVVSSAVSAVWFFIVFIKISLLCRQEHHKWESYRRRPAPERRNSPRPQPFHTSKLYFLIILSVSNNKSSLFNSLENRNP